MSKVKFPDWVTPEQQAIWSKRMELKEIEVKSLVTKGKTFSAIICRPNEIAVLMASEKLSNMTGNNMAASSQLLAQFCCLKHPDFVKECELGDGAYRIDHEIQIGRLIKSSYESSEVTVKKSLEEA